MHVAFVIFNPDKKAIIDKSVVKYVYSGGTIIPLSFYKLKKSSFNLVKNVLE